MVNVKTTFSSQVKRELCLREPKWECCKRAMLTAILISESKKVKSSFPEYPKLIYNLLKNLYMLSPQVTISTNMNSLQRTYQISIPMPESISDFLSTMEICKRKCCTIAFLRGCFLAVGTVVDPDKGNDIEMVFSDDMYSALSLNLCLKTLKSASITVKSIKRNNKYVIYIKDSSSISDFYTLVGAGKGLMNYENVRILKEVRNNVNRAVNCENANLQKSVDTAFRQLEAIRKIMDSGSFDKLSEPLRKIMSLRLENPEASLEELGKMLVPPLSKAGVSHRFKKIEEEAEKDTKDDT
ncbi:MAG: DNA-binding protein WhiA [Clostridiales bacterium]|jgi:DNA-binding protein WhiA|nr:DNA-binding protein WhiA [Clostridiales bacterium]